MFPEQNTDRADLGDKLLDFAEEAAKLAALVVALPAFAFAVYCWALGCGLLP